MPTWRHRHFFGVLLILLSSVITGPSFMSILSMVLELWQFSFTRNWPETQKIPPVWVLLNIWVDLGIPTLAQMSLIKCQCLLQIGRVTTLTISELIRVTQHRTTGGGDKLPATYYSFESLLCILLWLLGHKVRYFIFEMLLQLLTLAWLE